MRILAVLLCVLAGIALTGSGTAAQQPSDKASVAFQRLPDAWCFGPCPEWIALSGPIGKETPGLLRKVLAARPTARLLLVHSPGGDVASAEAIGTMVRQRKLDVIVAATNPGNCFDVPGNCKPGAIPEASIRPGTCASACVQVLAGGVNRAVWLRGRVGVHRFLLKSTTMVRRLYKVVTRTFPDGHKERSKTLEKETRTVVPQNREQVDRSEYAPARAYFQRMGIDLGLIDAILATPHADIRWLADEELRQWRLATTDDATALLMPPPPADTPRVTALSYLVSPGVGAGPIMHIDMQAPSVDKVAWSAWLVDDGGRVPRAPYTAVLRVGGIPGFQTVGKAPFLVVDNQLAGGPARPGEARLAEFCLWLKRDVITIEVRPEHPAASPALNGTFYAYGRKGSEPAQALCHSAGL